MYGDRRLKCRISSMEPGERNAGTEVSAGGNLTVWEGGLASLDVVVEDKMNEPCGHPAAQSLPITRNAATATQTDFCHPKLG